MSRRVFVIAEIGVNHNGTVDMAKQMIDYALEAGADAVKFQSFSAEDIAVINAPQAEYQKQTAGEYNSQFEMLRSLELDFYACKELLEYCRSRKIIFLSSPFDCQSIDELNELGLDLFKVPSGEITNLPYLRKLGELRKKIIMSTGMSNLAEVRKALDVLVRSGTPKENIIVLHCTTAYPAPVQEVNLLAMLTLKKELGVRTGYSDHTLGMEVAIAAVALGAEVIEKHFTLDKNMPGPDHKVSLEPVEFKAMIQAIRRIEVALGSPGKRPSPSEKKNAEIVRKGIVAKKYIQRGEVFSPENITIKRPAKGMSPMDWDKVIGKVAERNFLKDQVIEL